MQVSEGDRALENGLARFLMKVKENIDSGEIEEDGSISFRYSLDYKPEFSSDEGKAKVIYSHNELVAIQESVTKEDIERQKTLLPSKKFWRLPANGSGLPNRRGVNGKGHDERSGGKERGGAQNGNARNGRNGRNKRQGGSSGAKKMEKDNNEEYIALEEQMETTGNPMADFENWRNKMRELERKKKGLDADNGAKNKDDDDTAPAQNFSSISDFFNLKPDEKTKIPMEELEPATASNTSDNGTSARDSSSNEYSSQELDNGLSKQHDGTDEEREKLSNNNKGSSSRFSSFFHTGASPELIDSHRIAKPPSQSLEEARPAAGSRLLSLFNNDSKSSDSIPQHQQPQAQPQAPLQVQPQAQPPPQQQQQQQQPLQPQQQSNIPNAGQFGAGNNNNSRRGVNPAMNNGRNTGLPEQSSTTSLSSGASSTNSQQRRSNDASGSVFLQSLMSKGGETANNQSVPAPPGLSQQPPHQHQQQIPPHLQNQASFPNTTQQLKMGQKMPQIQPNTGYPVGMPSHMMVPPPMGMPPHHFQGGYAMPPPPPPGMGQPRVVNNGNNFPEHMVNQQQNQPMGQERSAGHHPQQPYMMPGMPMNYNGQNVPIPPQGFPQNSFPYGRPMMPPQFQQQPPGPPGPHQQQQQRQQQQQHPNSRR